MNCPEIKFVNEQAEYACETCKKRKKRCDKLLPNCSFCVSKNLPCNYYYSTSQNHLEGWRVPQLKYSGSGSDIQAAQRSHLPTVFFLDRTIFQDGQMEVPKPTIVIPTYFLKLLGSNQDISNMAQNYFNTVHTYLSIICKKAFFELLPSPILPKRADVVFLCICMRLVLCVSLEGEGGEVYGAVRSYLAELEAKGVFTLQVLQGRLLIALFEFGHGVYPAAYMSTSSCAAMGLALGLDDLEVKSGLSWVEIEERRRVWWAIVILERVLHLGIPGRRLVTKDPTAYDFLPPDDAAWDQGIMTPNYPINGLPPDSSLNMGRFARSAHAIHLLAQVTRHTTTNIPSPKIQEEEVMQLDRTLHSLINFCKLESKRTYLRFCNPVAICHSALLMLHGHYLSSEKLSIPRILELSWQAMHEICRNIAAEARGVIEAFRIVLPEVSPFVLDCSYKAAVFLIQMNRENPNSEKLIWIQTLKETLVTKNRRWKAAGEYLKILDAREVMNEY